MDATWITRLDATGDGIRVAVKDAIDVAGAPTTNGSPAVAASAKPADRDATCVARLRSAGARVVGKTNLHELCFGTTGINPTFGTPRNPVDPTRVPGGSSSGSAVAVATDEADVALGTDTGGSVRIPAACCGVVGLKTTHGRVAVDGVCTLAPSFDTVGFLAPSVATVAHAFATVAGESAAATAPAGAIARLRLPGITVDPGFDAAVDAALDAAGIAVEDVEVPEWRGAARALVVLLMREAWESLRHLHATGAVGEPVRSRLDDASRVSDSDVRSARAARARWRSTVDQMLSVAPVLALPTLVAPPDRVDAVAPGVDNTLCAPVNLAGLPALSVPLPGAPGSAVQLVGAAGSESALCATGAVIEAAVG